MRDGPICQPRATRMNSLAKGAGFIRRFSAVPASVHPLTRLKSRSTPPARPIRTWSAPVTPCSGRRSRASARKRRFMRLRTTAPPIFFVTVMPSRFTGSPSARSRTNRTKPGMGARFARFAARKSALLLIVTKGGSWPEPVCSGLLRRSASCGHGHDGRAEWRGHRVWPCGRGNRGGGHARDCLAERCASSLIP